MKSTLEIYCDAETLDVLDAGIRSAHSNDIRIMWNHKGMRGVIPSAILDGIYSIVDDFKARLRQYAEVPHELGRVTWDQCVLIPEDESRGPGPVSIGT